MTLFNRSAGLLTGCGLVATGLISVAVRALVAFPEHGAALRIWLDAPFPGHNEDIDNLQWWVTPTETNAVARWSITAADLRDVVSMDDGRTLLAVGEIGTILQSVDSGATWKSLSDRVTKQVDAPFRTSLHSIAVSPDGETAIAVGRTVITTHDGGKTWTDHFESPFDSVIPLDSSTVDASTGQGIAEGESGEVLTSDDHGETWTRRDSSFPDWIYYREWDSYTGRFIARGRYRRGSEITLDSVALDASTGRAIAVGESGDMLTSDDHGESWTRRDSVFSDRMYSVVLDSFTGRAIAVGGNRHGSVLTSDDYGQTWTERLEESTPGLRSVAMDALTGRVIAVGSNNYVLTSHDRGDSWTKREFEFSVALNSVAINASTGVAMASRGSPASLYISTDYGETWNERGIDHLDCFHSVEFDESSGRAIAVGCRGGVYTSDDLGENWIVRGTDLLGYLFSVAIDQSTGRAIAVGRGGMVITSNNRGKTWRERDFGTTIQFLNSVAFDAAATRVIALGINGGRGTVLTSDDKGETWMEQSPIPETPLVGISLAYGTSTGRAIAVGAIHEDWADHHPVYHPVYTTDDHGENWTKRDSGSRKRLTSVAYDESTGRAIAVGFGIVLTSDDHGETWTERVSGTSTGYISGAPYLYGGTTKTLSSVAYDASSGHAIAVGANGAVLTSNDHGRTWTQSASCCPVDSPGPRLNSVTFDAPTGRAVTVGELGNVFTSDDHGDTWTERDSGLLAEFLSVAFDAPTGRVIAVGMATSASRANGNRVLMLISDDHGATWQPIQWNSYPAPISAFGFLLILGGSLILLLLLLLLPRGR